MTRTLNLPLPLMNEITMDNFVTRKQGQTISGIASALNYGKISVRV